MISFRFSPEQQRWVDKAKRLQPVFAANARKYDESGTFPEANFDILREEGFLKLAIPREFGGEGTLAGFSAFTPHAVVETVAAACGGTGWGLLTQYHAQGLLATLGDDEQRSRVFGDVVQNGVLMATVGSEVMPQQLKAAANAENKLKFEAGLEPTEGGFIATATKGFASMAPASKYLLYWAIAPGLETAAEGMTISIVPAESPGVSFLPGWEEAIGIRASLSGGAKFDHVFIPWENVLGEPGDYVQKHPYTFELTYAAQLLGIAQGAFDFVKGLLAERPYLQTDDTVMYAVGEMSTALQATRTSWWYAQWLVEQEDWDEGAHAAMRALHQAKTTGLMVTTRAFDVVGVRALFKFNPLERAWRDVRTVTLHTRESQLMRLLAEGDIRGTKWRKEKYGPQLAPSKRRTWADLGLPRPSSR